MDPPLRALLLAAGLGTRLRPLTLTTPKCLVSVAGQPLLDRWLNQLERAGCEAVLINTHYLADQVVAFLQARRTTPMQISLIHEPVLLGTAGTLLANQDFFRGSTGLLIHADNAMADDLSGLLVAHHQRSEGCLLTMLTFETQNPSSCGIIEINEQGVVEDFQEKPRHPAGCRANGALYAFGEEFLAFARQLGNDVGDFSTQVIPALMGRIQTWHTQKPYMDIGTPAALLQANRFIDPLP